ncbi:MULTISPECIES: hypothetical protein [Pseudomonas]|uniref:hypothetical protein n=1 Tax=Pseudomonas TaxID=286 RepID=UPI0011B0C888|nr:MULTISPECIES: hypothetical protein [Pseudomonas]QXN48194.1 hypothetical protein KW062_18030 [Pseudomonas fluorescens]WSO22504.1 hypothetical protein VUJ50_18150 [Pseudomonas fluorescens]
MNLFDFLSVGFSAGQWPVEGVVEYSAMAAVEVLLEQQFGCSGFPVGASLLAMGCIRKLID